MERKAGKRARAGDMHAIGAHVNYFTGIYWKRVWSL